MKNNSYIFCQSEKNIHKIHHVLSKIGLTIVSKTNLYRKEKWVLFCPWKSDDKISLIWNRVFWPDGINQTDENVELLIDEVVFGRVDIDFLKKQKHENPLSEVIVGEIEKIARGYTEKGA